MFHRLFNMLPSLAGLLLATLAFALVFVKEIDEKLKDKRLVRWCLAVVLCVIGVTAFISDIKQKDDAESAHSAEMRKQSDEMNSIKDQLRNSELNRVSDTRYMQGKLDVFAQFALAIMKLAQATELSTRKTYEEKMLSNKELFDMTMKAVSKLREFSKRRKMQSDQLINQQIAAMQAAKTDEERMRVWQEQTGAYTKTFFQEDAEFRSSILPDAVYVRNELVRRKLKEPQPNRRVPAGMIESVFSGSLAGAFPELDAADYLEQMAKQLPLK
jgi:hypothetical protein